MLRDVDSEPGPPPGRRQDIGTRLDAVRARLKELGERDPDASRDLAAASERLEVAVRHAAAAHAFAVQVLSFSAEAFREAAEAHEHAASVHDRAAAAGIGDVLGHERRATFHRAAAAADWQRAERAQPLLSESEQAGLAAVSDEPRDGVAP